MTTPSVPPPLPPTPPPRQTPILLNLATPPQPRLDAGGWFTRTLAVVGGIVAVLVAIPLLVVVAIVALVLLLPAGHPVKPAVVQKSERESTDAATAKRYALEHLRRTSDVVALSEDCDAGLVRGVWVVSGSAVKADNQVVEAVVTLRLAVVGNTKRWQVESAMVDGELVD